MNIHQQARQQLLSRNPNNQLNLVPGQKLEIRHKRSVANATVIKHISPLKILVKIDETNETKVIGPNNIRIVHDPPNTPQQLRVAQSITEEKSAVEALNFLTGKKRAKNPVGRPRKHPRLNPLPGSKPEVMPDGKICLSTETKKVTIKGKPTLATVKTFSDGSQTITIKKSQLDHESLKQLRERQKKNKGALLSSEDVSDLAIQQVDTHVQSGTERINSHYQDGNLYKRPPCNYPIYDSTESVFINKQRELEPRVVVEDFLKIQSKQKFGNSDNVTGRILFSNTSIVAPDTISRLEVNPQWAQSSKFRLVEEDKTVLSSHQFAEDTENNPVMTEILATCPEYISESRFDNLKNIQSKIEEMELHELVEVLLPVLIDRFSTADILLANSLKESDNAEGAEIDFDKLDKHLDKCSRQLSWIKSNSKNVEESLPLETPRRAILTLSHEKDQASQNELLFDDENFIPVANVELEMKLVVDSIKMLKTCSAISNAQKKLLIDADSILKRVDMGQSTWGNSTKTTTQEQKSEFYQNVSEFVDMNEEYIFSNTQF